MATRRETNVVYGAGAVQGIVLVTFPAASTIFTDPDEYGLSKPLTSTGEPEWPPEATPASSPV